MVPHAVMNEPTPERTHWQSDDTRPVLIVGGAGFWGVSLAHQLLCRGERVLIFDNLSNPAAEANLRGLARQHRTGLEVEIADLHSTYPLCQAVERASCLFHFAPPGQINLNRGSNDPGDFKLNACGTRQLMESLRSLHNPPPLIFASTAKAYGPMDHLTLVAKGSRYLPADEELGRRGISESMSLDFENPLGCAWSAADQCVRDYARFFKLPAVVLRISSVYGSSACGAEDQGWIARLLTQAIRHQPLSIQGNGRQVRDPLFIDDLLDALLLARENAGALSGGAFNVGGGPCNTLSVLELLDRITCLTDPKPRLCFTRWRAGEQRYYAANTEAFQQATGWSPKTSPASGITDLYKALASQRKP